MTTPAYSHLERFRPWRLYLFIAGIAGLFALGVLAPGGLGLIVGVVVCVLLVFLGLAVALGGATWESWITGGRVHWVRPGRLWGHAGSCSVEDVTELRADSGATGEINATSCVLVLKDGRTRSIDRRCVGDVAEFYRALQRENPQIKWKRPVN